jgi:hypothetical protein
MRTLVTAALVGGLALGLPAPTGAAIPPLPPITAELTGTDNGGGPDRMLVESSAEAEGAKVKLFRVEENDGGFPRARVGTSRLDEQGDASFVVADENGRRKSTYFAVVVATGTTAKTRSNDLVLR